MLNGFFIYMAGSTISMVVFALAYRLFFSRLTHFQLSRWYLLGSLILAIIIPLIPLDLIISSESWRSSTMGSFVSRTTPLLEFQFNIQKTSESIGKDLPERGSPFPILPYILLFLYIAVCLFKAWRFRNNIRAVCKLIKQNQKESLGQCCLVRTKESLRAFSFLNYIFIPAHYFSLDKEDLALVVQHEEIHVRQKHTFDLLLYEVAAIFFWFNPALYYLRFTIRQVHEYLVDETITQSNEMVRKYGKLLIKLASESTINPHPILHTFSNQHFAERIKMLTKTKSKPMEKLKFLCSFPILALSIVLCSCLDQDSPTSPDLATTVQQNPKNTSTISAQDTVIRSISWQGNTLYTDAKLNEVLGIKPGEEFDKATIDQKFNYNPEGKDVPALFMDKGYLFFAVEPTEVYTKEGVDLVMNVSEGPQVTIGKVTINGNEKVNSRDILQKISLKTGEVFDRSALIKSQLKLKETGYFKPETILINPVPYQDVTGAWVVDIEFTVEEI